MLARGDRDHDIAAWFGVNQGRIKDTKDGKFGVAQPATANQLPPKGAPGVKGRHLRNFVRSALDELDREPPNVKAAIQFLRWGQMAYDENEA
jgi:hypothetical protein